MTTTARPDQSETVRLVRSVRLPAPPDHVFAVVADPRQLVEVIPGATLTRWDGTSFDATVRLRLGLLRVAGHGVGRVTVRDRVARTVVVEVTTRSGRWVAEAAASVDDSSSLALVADLLVPAGAGRIGRSLLADVGNRMFDQASAALTAKLAGFGGEPAAVPAPAPRSVGVPRFIRRRLGRPRAAATAAAAAVAGAAAVTIGVAIGAVRHVVRRR